MSLRAYTDHVDDYNRTHTIEIHKSGYGGSVDYLKNTGSGYASFDYEKIDPKSPTENPIQKGALEFSLWLDSSTLIDEIKTADEQTFWAIHKVDGTQEWIGYIYNDLSTYEEGFDNHPFRITLMAKDFTDLGGKAYLVSSNLPDSREKVIETIAYLLDTVGFSMPIKTHTSWIEENIGDPATVGDYDYLNQIYHETKALRTFGSTEDETDQPITVEEALNQLCVSHGLLLKQANGCYWIDQLTEYEDPLNVQEAEYTLNGKQSSLTTGNDLTVAANTADLKVTIQPDNRDNSGPPGLKRVKNTFAHRTQISRIKEFTFTLDGTNTTEDSISQTIISDGDQKIPFSIGVVADTSVDTSVDITFEYVLRSGTYYWDQANYRWTENGGNELRNEITLTETTDKPGLEIYKGGQSYTTDFVPAAADGLLEVKAYIPTAMENADVAGTIDINDAIAKENSQSVNFELTQTGGFSVVNTIEDTWYGDGPTPVSPSALRYSTSDTDITQDSWQRRGASPYRNFHENRTKEVMDVRRGWRRLLSATLKGKYYPWQILSYDSEYFYFVGGSWDLFTGNWEGQLFALDIQTGSDTFDDILKFSDEGTSGTGSTTTSSGSFDPSTYDGRWLNEGENLGDLDNVTTAQTNLKLKDQTADLDLNSLAINGDDLFTLFYTESEIDSFFDLYYSKADLTDGGEDLDLNSLSINGTKITATPAEINILDGATLTTAELNQLDGNAFTSGMTGTTADFSGSLDASTLRSDTGKFLSPNSYQFRNAGDTGFRSIEAADITSNGRVDIGSASFSDAVLRIRSDDATVLTSSSITGGNHSAGITIDNLSTTNDMGAPITWRGRSTGTAFGAIAVTFPSADNSVMRFYTENSNTFAERMKIDSTGIVLSESLTGTDATFSALVTADAGATVNNTDLTVNSGIDLNGNMISSGKLEDDGFTSGWQGTNWQILDSGDAELQNLRVRGGLEVYELILNRLRYQDGGLIVGAGGGKVSTVVDGTVGNEIIEFEDPEGNNIIPFSVGAIIMMQDFDLNRTTVVKKIVRKVDAINTVNGKEQLTLSDDSDANTSIGWEADTDDTGVIAAGDDLVAIGHVSDTSLDSFIYMSAVDSNNPFFRIMDGVDTYTKFNLGSDTGLRLQLGNLEGTYGYADGTEVYGFAAGDPNSDHTTVDPTNGIRFLDGSGNIGGQFNASEFILGDNSKTSNYISFDVSAGTGDINLGTFRLNTPNLDINSATPRIDVGSSHFLDGSTDTASFSNGILTADGTNITAANWTIESNDIRSSVNDSRLFMRSQQASATQGDVPTIYAYEITNTVGVFMGLTRDSGGWTDEFGFSLGTSLTADPYFQVTRNLSDDSFTAQIAGANFDGGAMWAGAATKANATFLADWANETLTMGSVFSADGGADTGRLASSYFDATDLWGGNATKANANIRLDFANSELTTEGTEGRTIIGESGLEQQKVTGAGGILLDALDSTGSRIDINGDSYKVARFQEGSIPQLGVPQEYTGSTGGSANALPSNPVSYVPIEIPNSNTGQVNVYVIPVYNPASTPATPTNVTLCAHSNPDGIQISWDNMSVDSYEVERAENSAGPWQQIASTTSTSYIDDGVPPLQPDTTYYYRVRSVNNGLVSGWSNVKSGSYNSLGAC